MLEHGSLGRAAPFPAPRLASCPSLPCCKGPHAYIWDSPAACLSPGHTASTQPPLTANCHPLETPLAQGTYTSSRPALLGTHCLGGEHWRSGRLKQGL